jgi:hypothetical protein
MALDLNALHQNYSPIQLGQPQQKKDNGNFFTSLIPTGTGTLGAAGGAALGTAIAPGIGTLIGALLGGAAGGGAGKVGENAIEGKQNIREGVPQEAAISGVLGAGPLRLAKGAVDVARGVRAGAGLTGALTNAGENAVNSSIRGAVGNKLTNASNDLAIKDFRLNPSQLNNFKNKFGEDVSQTIKKYGLVGKDSQGIQEKAIQPLQNEFDSIATKIPEVPTSTLLKSFESKYKPLMDSAVQDKQAIGQQLKDQADQIVKKYGTTVDSNELASLRKEFDSLVSYADKSANPARYGVNKRAADAIRSTLQQEADKNGLTASNGMTFKQVGQELSKLRQLSDNVSKQEQVGRGSLPAGLTDILGSIAGGSALGPAGIAGGAVAAKVVNSGAGRRAAAALTEKAGQSLTEKAASRNPYGLGPLALRLGSANAAQGLLSLPNSDNTITNPTNTTASTNAVNPFMTPSYNNDQNLSSTPQSPYTYQNLQSDIQRDPKNADKYVAFFSDISKAYSTNAPKPLTATQLQQANNAQSGLGALQTIQSELQRDPTILAKGAIPTSIGKNIAGAGVLETARKEAADVISRLRTGAAINKEEEAFYRGQLPQFGDSADTINYKMNLLGSLFDRFANPQAAQPDNATTDLSSALQAIQ